MKTWKTKPFHFGTLLLLSLALWLQLTHLADAEGDGGEDLDVPDSLCKADENGVPNTKRGGGGDCDEKSDDPAYDPCKPLPNGNNVVRPAGQAVENQNEGCNTGCSVGPGGESGNPLKMIPVSKAQLGQTVPVVDLGFSVGNIDNPDPGPGELAQLFAGYLRFEASTDDGYQAEIDFPNSNFGGGSSNFYLGGAGPTPSEIYTAEAYHYGGATAHNRVWQAVSRDAVYTLQYKDEGVGLTSGVRLTMYPRHLCSRPAGSSASEEPLRALSIAIAQIDLSFKRLPQTGDYGIVIDGTLSYKRYYRRYSSVAGGAEARISEFETEDTLTRRSDAFISLSSFSHAPHTPYAPAFVHRDPEGEHLHRDVTIYRRIESQTPNEWQLLKSTSYLYGVTGVWPDGANESLETRLLRMETNTGGDVVITQYSYHDGTTYDANGEPDGYSDKLPGLLLGESSSNGDFVKFSYYDDGRIKSVTRPITRSDGVTLANSGKGNADHVLYEYPDFPAAVEPTHLQKRPNRVRRWLAGALASDATRTYTEYGTTDTWNNFTLERYNSVDTNTVSTPIRGGDGATFSGTQSTTTKAWYVKDGDQRFQKKAWITADGMFYFSPASNQDAFWNDGTQNMDSGEPGFYMDQILGPFAVPEGQNWLTVGNSANITSQLGKLITIPHRTKYRRTIRNAAGQTVHSLEAVAISAMDVTDIPEPEEPEAGDALDDAFLYSTGPFRLLSSRGYVYHINGNLLLEYADGQLSRTHELLTTDSAGTLDYASTDVITGQREVTRRNPEGEVEWTSQSLGNNVVYHHTRELPLAGGGRIEEDSVSLSTSFGTENRTTRRKYDSSGRILEHKLPGQPATLYSYNSAENRTTIARPGVTTSEWTQAGTTYVSEQRDNVTTTSLARKRAALADPRSLGTTGLSLGGGASPAPPGQNPPGFIAVMEARGASITPENTIFRVTDGAGRVVMLSSPASGQTGRNLTVRTYNAAGHLVKISRTGMADAITERDVTGEMTAAGYDLNQDGELAKDGTEPCTLYFLEYVVENDALWEVRTRKVLTGPGAQPQEAPTQLVTVSRRKVFCGPHAESIVTSPNGSSQRAWTEFTGVAGSKLEKRYSSYKASGVPTEGGAILSTETWNKGVLTTLLTPSGSISYVHDGYGRITSQSGAQGTAAYVYNDFDQPTSSRPPGASAATTFEYYPSTDTQGRAGRVEKQIQPDGTFVEYDYYATGQVKDVSGTGTYPSSYEYNALGQMTKLTTWRTAGQASTASVTIWNYDPLSHLLTSKEIDGQTVTTYTYYATGRVHTRTDARGVVTTYGYDTLGRLASVDYSDNTPDVVYDRDIAGRLKLTEDGVSNRSFTYGATSGSMTRTDPYVDSLLADYHMVFTRSAASYDEVSLITLQPATGGGQTFHEKMGYTYTASSPGLKGGWVGDVRAQLNYTEEPLPGLPGTMYYSSNTNGEGNPIGPWGGYDITRTTDEYKRIQHVTAKNGSLWLEHYYLNRDSMGRITRRDDTVNVLATSESGYTAWHFDYNPRGEVTSATKKLTTSGQPALPGYSFGYGFDDLGNPTTRTASLLTSAAQSTTFAANNKHQLTGRTNPDPAARLIKGSAANPGSNPTLVSIKQRNVKETLAVDVPVQRLSTSWTGISTASGNASHSEWRAFAGEALAGVTIGPKVLEVTTTGTKNLGYPAQARNATQKGLIWLPPAHETFGYDQNGNLTSDSQWSMTWDAENRLKTMQTTAAAVAAGWPATKLEFAYDSQHRRVRKAVYRGTAAGAWVLTRDLRFVYDGWNLIAEVIVMPGSNQKKLLRSYAWGPDLSGTRQGAGGVGGLLTVKQYRPDGSHIYLAPAYDSNGNVTAYYDLATKQAVYRFEYDAFGREITFEQAVSGSQQPEAPPFRFSTKYTDGETGLVYYGYRYYSPELGRWISRDPIGERGGLNLYGMVGNDAVNWVDVLGLEPIMFDTLEAAGRAGLEEDKKLTFKSDDLSKRTALQRATGRPQGWYGWEYCGLVCKKVVNGQCKYIYTGPRTDQKNGACNSEAAACPDGWEQAGRHHSHPDGSVPSIGDHVNLDEDTTGYVGSGSGTGPDYSYGRPYQPAPRQPLHYPKTPLPPLPLAQ